MQFHGIYRVISRLGDFFYARNGDGINLVRVHYSGTQLIFTMSGTGASRTAAVEANRWYSIELDWEASDSGSLFITLQGAGSDTPIAITPITEVDNAEDRIAVAFNRGEPIFEDGFEDIVPE